MEKIVTDGVGVDCISSNVCMELCKSKYCTQTGLYYAVGILSSVTAFLAILSVLLFSLYKKERNQRLKLWSVKTEDISLETAQYSKTKLPSLSFSECGALDEKLPPTSKKQKHYFTSTGYYKGRLVAVQKYRVRRLSLDKTAVLSDLDQVFQIDHEHICKFYGAHLDGGHVTVLMEYCTRGSLYDLLKDQEEWDDVFKNSLIFDIVKGMLYLHQSAIGSHGNLKPSNCLIDSRFMVKITDFGKIGEKLKAKERNYHKNEQVQESFERKLWTAPELLLALNSPKVGTKKGDVYSFSIIAQEILYQRGTFYRREDALPADEIILQVTAPPSEEREAFRPTLHDDDDIVIQEQWRKTLRRCWEEDPSKRLSFQEIYQVAMRLQTENTLMDNLLQRLQKYSNRLEEKVEEKTEQYKAEKERSDSLLYQMLPRSIANRLKINTDVMPESYSQVTVYFSDIVGFSAICHKSQPLDVVQMLNDLYTMFDQIIDEFDVYKVETIGDAYMVVSGLPIRNVNNHAREIARMAIRLRDSVSNDFVIRHLPNETLRLRVGIHSGPVVAGVVGLKMPRYCLFGDTVNTAARMEQTGAELKIHTSPHTKEILDEFGTFVLTKRKQSVTLKGLGEWNTWWLIGEKSQTSDYNIDEESHVDNGHNNNGEGDKQSFSSSGRTTQRKQEYRRVSDAAQNFEINSNTKPRTQETNHKPSAVRRGSSYSVPARYRPSCHANPTKQRRLNGSNKTPLFTMSGHERTELNNEQLALLTPPANCSAIGAIF